MALLALLLALAGAVCFGLSAADRPVGRVNLVSLGLLLVTLALICQFVGITDAVTT